MDYEIDQSGKLEDTRNVSVIAYANGMVKSLKISAVEKRRLLGIMRLRDYPKKLFVYKAFAALIFLLLGNEKVETLTIDREYPGHEALIKNVLLNLYRRDGLATSKIVFAEIGKKSPAHKVALEVFRNVRRADILVRVDNVFRII